MSMAGALWETAVSSGVMPAKAGIQYSAVSRSTESVRSPLGVMAGFIPAILCSIATLKTWMAGTSPAMTAAKECFACSVGARYFFINSFASA
jgi:hypothetical protein